MNIKVILDKQVPLPSKLTSTFPEQNKPLWQHCSLAFYCSLTNCFLVIAMVVSAITHLTQLRQQISEGQITPMMTIKLLPNVVGRKLTKE